MPRDVRDGESPSSARPLLTACGANSTGHTPTTTPSPTMSPAGTITAMISGLGANSLQPEPLLAADDSAVWVHNGQSGSLLRVDPTTNSIVATIPVGHGEGGVAIGQGAIWVANPLEGTVSRIDPQTNKVVATISIPGQSNVVSIAVSPDAVWVTDFLDDMLLRIDPQTNQIIARIPNTPGIVGVSFGAGSVWICNHHSDTQGVIRLNPATNQTQAQINPAPNQGFCSSVVALGQTIWTSSFFSGDPSTSKFERLDPATNTVVATISTPDVAPFHFAANAEGVWGIGDVGLYKIDPATNQLAGVLSIPDATGLTLGAGSVWALESSGTLLRITPAN